MIWRFLEQEVQLNCIYKEESLLISFVMELVIYLRTLKKMFAVISYIHFTYLF